MSKESTSHLRGTGVFIKAPGHKDGKRWYRTDYTPATFIMFDRATFTWRVSRFRTLIIYDELLIFLENCSDRLSDNRYLTF